MLHGWLANISIFLVHEERWLDIICCIKWIFHVNRDLNCKPKQLAGYHKVYSKNIDLLYLCHGMVSTQVHTFSATSAAGFSARRRSWLWRGRDFEGGQCFGYITWDIDHLSAPTVRLWNGPEIFAWNKWESLSCPALPWPKVYRRRCMLHLSTLSSFPVLYCSDAPQWFLLDYWWYLIEDLNLRFLFKHRMLTVGGHI